jgi:hypothetical protein
MKRGHEMKTETKLTKQRWLEIVSEFNVTHYTDDMLHEQFDEFINEVYSPIEIFGMTFYASDILKENGPIAYRCSFNDYIDGQDDIVIELFGEYYDRRETESILSDLQLFAD